MDEIQQRILNGDGGNWIKETYDPDAIFQLDRYALNERECPRDTKLFYGITENKKSANDYLTQTIYKARVKFL